MSRDHRHTRKATIHKKIDTLRLIRGFDRAAHFAAGGTPADWRGECDIRPDEQKELDKRLCRKDITEDERISNEETESD